MKLSGDSVIPLLSARKSGHMTASDLHRNTAANDFLHKDRSLQMFASVYQSRKKHNEPTNRRATLMFGPGASSPHVLLMFSSCSFLFSPVRSFRGRTKKTTSFFTDQTFIWSSLSYFSVLLFRWHLQMSRSVWQSFTESCLTKKSSKRLSALLKKRPKRWISYQRSRRLSLISETSWVGTTLSVSSDVFHHRGTKFVSRRRAWCLADVFRLTVADRRCSSCSSLLQKIESVLFRRDGLFWSLVLFVLQKLMPMFRMTVLKMENLIC